MEKEKEATGEERQAPADDDAAPAPEEAGADEGAAPDAGESAEEAAARRIAELEDEVASLTDRLLRAAAETDNVRKRAQKDREDAARFAASRFAEDILAVADNLRRALETDRTGAARALVEGVELTVKELDTVLQRHGIEAVEAAGARFDPNLHQAMFEVETDEAEAGTVTQVLRGGYTIHGRLLRPAMVAVARAPAAQRPEKD